MIKICIYIFVLFLPCIVNAIPAKDSYKDIKNPGLYTFLTESYKSISDIKDLPQETEFYLEKNQFNDQNQRWLEAFTREGRFENFKLVLAGIAKKSFYIYYQTGSDFIWDHMAVFSKKGKGIEICYKSQLPAKMIKPSLNDIRKLVCSYYRRNEKFKKINSFWVGDFKKGWTNSKLNIKIQVSNDLKSVIATEQNGKKLWCSNVIDDLDSEGFWGGGEKVPNFLFPKLYSIKKDDQNMVELYPKKIDGISFGEGIVNVSFGSRCWGEIDLKTGKFEFLGRD